MKLEDVKKLMAKEFTEEEISVLKIKAETLLEKDITTEKEAEEVISTIFPLMVSMQFKSPFLQKTLKDDIQDLLFDNTVSSEDNTCFFNIIDFAKQVIILYHYLLSFIILKLFLE